MKLLIDKWLRAGMLCWSLFGVSAYADLVWVSRDLNYKAKIGEKEYIGEFKFTNKGASSVSIKNIETGCACTVAKCDKLVFQPGAEGTISVLFRFGGRVGLQENTVRVFTTNPNVGAIVLHLSVAIPEVFTVSPRILVWRSGESIESKDIVIQMNSDIKLEKVEVETAIVGQFVFSTKREGNKSYRISVQPNPSWNTNRSMADIVITTGDEKRRFAVVFIRN